MGSTHLKALQGLAEAELAAVVSNDPAQLSGDLSGTQGNFGGPGEKYDFSAIRKYSRIEEALSDPDIEAVDLCLPTHMHAPVALAALRAGKHVLVEKPMALTGEEADAMREEAARSGRVLMTAHVLRFWPTYEALIELIAGGRLGPVRSAIFRRRCAMPGWGGWLLDPASSGGGVFDLLIHDVDLCLRLFGAPASVSASGHEAMAAGVDVILGEFHYPGIGTVAVTGGWHHAGSYPFAMEYTVVADRGVVEYSSAGRPPALYKADGTSEALPVPEKDGYREEIAYFLQCCARGSAPELCPPEQSAAAVKLTRLMLEARSRKGETIACRI